jgi:hypothetical protein
MEKRLGIIALIAVVVSIASLTAAHWIGGGGQDSPDCRRHPFSWNSPFDACRGVRSRDEGGKTAHLAADAPFQSILMRGAGQLEVAIGPTQSIRVDGDGEDVEAVKAEIVDGTLSIKAGRERGWWFGGNSGAATIHVTMPRLDALTLAGAGAASVTGLDGGKSNFALSGAGSLKATGRLDSLILTLNGAGSARLGDLAVTDAVVTINGAGSAVVSPSASLLGTVNGVGSVLYTTEPAKLVSNVHGVGVVTHR